MGKPTICIGENKDADQRLCFRYSDSTVPLLLKSKIFQASSSFLCLYRPVCVAFGQKPHCWFSQEAAQMSVLSLILHFISASTVCNSKNLLLAV